MLLPRFGFGAGDTAGVPASSTPGTKTYQWAAAWVILILLVALATQSKAGYALLYYALVLALVFLLLTQYKFIASALAPIGQPAPASG